MSDAEEPARRSRRGRYLAVAVLVVLAAGGTLAAVNAASGRPTTGASVSASVATAPVVRGDVVDTTTVEGTLTYGNQRQIPAVAAGTVTWLPTTGAVVRQGQPLFKVDDRPVTLLYGAMPLYRTLQQGEKGPDVRELEENLKALGYGDGAVGSSFDADTTAAVKAWQRDLGLSRTGRVEAGQVVVESGPVRIATLGLSLGGRSGGGTALTVTDVGPTVHIDLGTDKTQLVRVGETVQVTMPDGSLAKGLITSVGSVAQPAKDANSPSTVGVEVALRLDKVGHVDQAPVSVQLESARAKDVLSVPVEALLALREGGFGVETVDASGRHRIVPVTTGTFGGGRVQVTGAGLAAGTRVEVPSP